MIEKNTRKLFQAWLYTPDGGALAGRVPSSYGTYVQQCGRECCDADIFKKDSLDVIEAQGLERLRSQIDYSRVMLTKAQISEKACLNNVKTGLRAFSGFLSWLLEYYPLARSFDQCWELIEAAGPLGESAAGTSGKPHKQKKATVPKTAYIVDSYQQLFDYFAHKDFTPANLYKFGLEKSIYANRISMENVKVQFNLLVSLLENGSWGSIDSQGRTRKNLHIRKYSGDKQKSQFYVELYSKVFPKVRIIVEDSGNTAPKENLKQITKCQPFSQGEDAANMHLFLKNYQCSHVLDNRTKNPLLFEAVWNVVFTPKIIDPLTGHETLGRWPLEFQPRFRNEIRRRFRSLMEQFNTFADKYRTSIENAAREVVEAHKELEAHEKQRFIADVLEQWEPICCGYEAEPEVSYS